MRSKTDNYLVSHSFKMDIGSDSLLNPLEMKQKKLELGDVVVLKTELELLTSGWKRTNQGRELVKSNGEECVTIIEDMKRFLGTEVNVVHIEKMWFSHNMAFYMFDISVIKEIKDRILIEIVENIKKELEL